MSHFTVAVITDDINKLEGMLAPYQENNMDDCPREYLEFNSNTITYENINNTFTPSFITPSALTRGVNGEAQTYTLGVILYAYDLGNNSSLTWYRLGNGQSITNFPASVKNIKVRLYTTQANDLSLNNPIPHADLISTSNDYYKYLVDMETIPVLESAEGYEFGGENLIRWSKTLPVSATKWRHASTGASVIEDSDGFSIMNFNITDNIIDSDQSNDKWYHFYSPKIPLSTEMIGTQFCLSFWIKFKDFSKLDYASLSCIASVDFEGNVRNAYSLLGYFLPNRTHHLIKLKSKSSINQDEWCECYTIFTLNDSLMTSTDNKDENGNKSDPTLLENCNYFRIGFYVRNNAVLQIKKPKLEMGNVPTSWSASPYDIDYENISGANLISNGYRVDLTTDAQEIYSELRANTIYTLSWNNIEPNGTTLYITIGSKAQTAITSPYTFDSETAQSFKLRSSRVCTVKLLKLEIGNTATPFTFDQSQLNALFSFSNEGVNSFVNSAKGIIGADGKLIPLTNQAAIQALTENLGQKVSLLEDRLEVTSTSITDSLHLIEQKIKVGDSYNGQLAITLSTNAANINATKLALTSDRLVFLVNNEEVAYMSNQRLHITHAIIENSLQIGNIKFIPTSSGTAIVAVEAVG